MAEAEAPSAAPSSGVSQKWLCERSSVVSAVFSSSISRTQRASRSCSWLPARKQCVAFLLHALHSFEWALVRTRGQQEQRTGEVERDEHTVVLQVRRERRDARASDRVVREVLRSHERSEVMRSRCW